MNGGYSEVIAIVGCDKKIKSDLTSKICERLAQLGLLAERPDYCPSIYACSEPEMFLGFSYETALWSLNARVYAELHAQTNADIVVVDAPIHEAVAQLELALHLTHRSIDNYQRGLIYSLARTYSDRYRAIFNLSCHSYHRHLRRSNEMQMMEAVDRSLHTIGGCIVNVRADCIESQVETICEHLFKH